MKKILFVIMLLSMISFSTGCAMLNSPKTQGGKIGINKVTEEKNPPKKEEYVFEVTIEPVGEK